MNEDKTVTLLGAGFKAAFALVALSLFLHILGAGKPATVVFDEVHFGKFVNAYCCTGEHIFDIHPPHSKLLIAGVARVLGYEGKPEYQSIGDSYEGDSPLTVRILPMLCGVLLPLIIFVLLRQLGGSVAAATLGGLMIALDNSILTQTRIIALDGFLLVGTFGSLAAFLAGAKRDDLLSSLPWMALSGALAALAVGSKFTGLLAFAMPAVFCGVELLRSVRTFRWRYWLINAAAFTVLAATVYLLGWYLHFALLIEPGSGDVWGAPTGRFWEDFWNIHQIMLGANYNLTSAHQDASPWWSWPWMLTPVFYWSQAKANIYFLGNPAVWWVSSVMFIVVLINLGLARISALRLPEAANRSLAGIWLPIAGYVIALFPFVGIPRPLFMYHYLTPLVFSIMAVLLWLDRIAWTHSGSLFKQRASVYTYVYVLVVTFFCLAPLSYGSKMGAGLAQKIFEFFPGWR